LFTYDKIKSHVEFKNTFPNKKTTDILLSDFIPVKKADVLESKSQDGSLDETKFYEWDELLNVQL